MSATDYVVLGGYFAILIAVGFRAQRSVVESEDYFVARRKFGKWMMAFSNFGASVSSTDIVLTSGQAWRHGFSGIWIGLYYVLLSPFFWFSSKWFRRLRYVTNADFLQHRYESRGLAGLYAVQAALLICVVIAMGFSAMGDSIVGIIYAHNEYVTLSKKDLFLVVLIVVLLTTLAYSVLGGYVAAVLADCIQSAFMVVISFLLLPLALNRVGGLANVRADLPSHLFDVLGSAEVSAFTWYSVCALVLMILAGYLASPTNMALNASRDERIAQIGPLSGLFLKRFCTIGWALTGVAAIVLIRQDSVPTNEMFGVLTIELLRPLGFGLVGLVIAGLLAALMSSVSVTSVVAAAALTRNFYQSILVPQKSDKHYMLVGRILTIVVMTGSCVLALYVRDIMTLFWLGVSIGLIFGPSFWFGMFWRRANAKAAYLSLGVGLVAVYGFPALLAHTSLASDPKYCGMTRAVEITRRGLVATEFDVRRGNATKVGETFDYVARGEREPLFFTQLTTLADGTVRGAGLIRVEVFLLHLARFDVSRLTLAHVNTLKVVYPITMLFGSFWIGGLLTRPQQRAILNRFFARMLVPARAGRHDEEMALIERAGNNYRLVRHLEWFPESDWVLCKPDSWMLRGSAALVFITALFIAVVWWISRWFHGAR